MSDNHFIIINLQIYPMLEFSIKFLKFSTNKTKLLVAIALEQ